MPALRRAVAILDYLSERCGGASATDIARDLNVPKSTAHGLLVAMEELGLLIRESDGRLRTGPRSLRWANDFIAGSDLVSVFKQYFHGPHPLAGYTVTMTVLEGAEVVYIACSHANQPLGVTFRIGMRLPAPFTATGKALLGALSEEELEQRLGGDFPAPLTRHSVTDLAHLKQELPQLAQRGYSIDDGETREGMTCLGTTVRDHTGQAVAGLAISLTRTEAVPDKVAELGARLRQAAQDISATLGAPR
ncbi:IclR family transcriptional regulator [Stappia taiwanensis]|uniref:IclR family transcriptional regulator n=1 Tax=Stappia taiwanensis TaxID=992267 RepID=A0A838Y0E3_9HYPH|nr:IclR family transcriptional regulator [Stappia taiwanensis]MBA4612440.1 IclR family transcriptional regulator [Stappia taiwanensis]